MNNALTQARLLDVLSYSPDTGVFVWKQRPSEFARWNTRYAGTRAGSLFVSGSTTYTRIAIDGVGYRAHRLAWLYMFGAFPLNDIDHVNGVGTDNRISNLRDVDRRTNLQNQAISPRSTTGVTGVHWNKHARKYVASAKFHRKYYYGGVFDTIEAAAEQAKAMRTLLGFHENHGHTREQRQTEVKP